MIKKLIAISLMLSLAFAPSVFAYFQPDGVKLSKNSIEFEGATENAFETTVSVTDPTADRTVTVPDADVTLGTPNATSVDTAELVANAVDATILQDVVADSSANQACSTTCGIAGCYMGWDTGSSVFVGCADATADTCACDGATS